MPRGSNWIQLDPEVRRKYQSWGGQSQPIEAKSFYKDPEKAKEAGRRGGLARAANAAKRKEMMHVQRNDDPMPPAEN